MCLVVCVFVVFVVVVIVVVVVVDVDVVDDKVSRLLSSLVVATGGRTEAPMAGLAHVVPGPVHLGAAPQPAVRVRVTDTAPPHRASECEGKLTELPLGLDGAFSYNRPAGFPLRLSR